MSWANAIVLSALPVNNRFHRCGSGHPNDSFIGLNKYWVWEHPRLHITSFFSYMLENKKANILTVVL
jgi:hypothetical protein